MPFEPSCDINGSPLHGREVHPGSRSCQLLPHLELVAEATLPSHPSELSAAPRSRDSFGGSRVPRSRSTRHTWLTAEVSTNPNRSRVPFAGLALDYPMSIGVFATYPEAQKAVDTLSDEGFPVENCLIVGTELRQLERVTGRLTWGRVLLGGALSGMWLGLFVGFIFSMFESSTSPLAVVGSTMVFGAVFGTIWAAFGYGLTRGQRDFTSVSRIVPGRFEVLAEHKVAQRAREILAAAGIAVPRPWETPPEGPASGQAPSADSTGGPTPGAG